MKIVNVVGKDITIKLASGESRVIPALQPAARVAMSRSVLDDVAGLPASVIWHNEIVNLPPAEAGTVYLADGEVVERLGGFRLDVFAPDFVRDEDGKELFCRGLVRW